MAGAGVSGGVDPQAGPQPGDDECRYCEGEHLGGHCECCSTWLEHEVEVLSQTYQHGPFTWKPTRDDVGHLLGWIERLERQVVKP